MEGLWRFICSYSSVVHLILRGQLPQIWTLSTHFLFFPCSVSLGLNINILGSNFNGDHVQEACNPVHQLLARLFACYHDFLWSGVIRQETNQSIAGLNGVEFCSCIFGVRCSSLFCSVWCFLVFLVSFFCKQIFLLYSISYSEIIAGIK